MSIKAKILKLKKFKYMADTMEPIKDGRFFILTRSQRLKPRDSMRNLDSTSTDHSTLFQSFHSIELLSAMVLTMFG
jgi:hypothetical protein